MVEVTLTRTAWLPSPLGEVTRVAATLAEGTPLSEAVLLAAEVMESVLAVEL